LDLLERIPNFFSENEFFLKYHGVFRKAGIDTTEKAEPQHMEFRFDIDKSNYGEAN